MTSSADRGLRLSGLRVETDSGRPVVEDVDLVAPGATIAGIVGESGSGKTTTALALLGYARSGLRIVSGRLSVDSDEMDLTDEAALTAMRGARVSYVPQDPQTALNPSLRAGRALSMLVRRHQPNAGPDEIHEAVRATLARVQLPTDREFLRRFPHQLSGGQQQRLALGLALVAQPRCVVLDEPTTGLDVLTKRAVVAELRNLQARLGITFILVSHDLALVSAVCDSVTVMYAGRVVEQCDASQLKSLAHPYSEGLVASVPDIDAPRRMRGMPGVAVGVHDRPVGCGFAPRCERVTVECTDAVPPLHPVVPDHHVRCLHPLLDRPQNAVANSDDVFVRRAAGVTTVLECRGLTISHPSPTGPVTIVRDASLTVTAGECVALVGESGSGKTSIARCIAGLIAPDSGDLRLAGQAIQPLARDRTLDVRRRAQIVFQNPYDSMNPRQDVETLLSRPLKLFHTTEAKDRPARVRELLDMVHLSVRLSRSFPHELSGGERQRVAIARALAAEPDLVICDEITSALDVSVQANVLHLLEELRGTLDLSMLFITHDLGVVASIADRTVVLRNGGVVEEGETLDVLRTPRDTYTKELVDSARWSPVTRKVTNG